MEKSEIERINSLLDYRGYNNTESVKKYIKEMIPTLVYFNMINPVNGAKNKDIMYIYFRATTVLHTGLRDVLSNIKKDIIDGLDTYIISIKYFITLEVVDDIKNGRVEHGIVHSHYYAPQAVEYELTDTVTNTKGIKQLKRDYNNQHNNNGNKYTVKLYYGKLLLDTLRSSLYASKEIINSSIVTINNSEYCDHEYMLKKLGKFFSCKCDNSLYALLDHFSKTNNKKYSIASINSGHYKLWLLKDLNKYLTKIIPNYVYTRTLRECIGNMDQNTISLFKKKYNKDVNIMEIMVQVQAVFFMQLLKEPVLLVRLP